MFSVITDELPNHSLTTPEPPHKRQRLSAEHGHSNKGAGVLASSLPAAFHLLRTKGIADRANECAHKLLATLFQRLVCVDSLRASTTGRSNFVTAGVCWV